MNDIKDAIYGLREAKKYIRQPDSGASKKLRMMDNIDRAINVIDLLYAYYRKNNIQIEMTEDEYGWYCPKCHMKLAGKTAMGYPCSEFDLPNNEAPKFCPACGQPVKYFE